MPSPLLAPFSDGVRAIWRGGYRYRKAGVVLLDLRPANPVQEAHFDKCDDARRIPLMRTIDQINRFHGRDTVSFAAAGIRRPWKMQRERLSPCCTTEWEGLLRV